MAAGVNLLDTSSKVNNINKKLQADQTMAASRAELSTAKNDKSTEWLKREYQHTLTGIERQYDQQMANIVFQWTSDLISFGGKIYSLVEDEQVQQANNDISGFVSRFNTSLQESIADGSTRYVETENGLEFQLAPKLQQEYDSFVQSIQDSDLMGSVKKRALASLGVNFEQLKANGASAALQQAYQDRNSLFDANLSNNLVNDAQMLASNGGTLPEGIGFSGVATIMARTDWSDARKDAAILEYTGQVQAQYAIESGVGVALGSGGLQAAYDHIYSISGLTMQQKQTAYNYAVNAVNNRASSISGSASEMMTNAIAEGSMPGDVYQTVLDNVQHEPPEVRTAVYNALKAAQVEAVTAIATNQYNDDFKGGLVELEQTLADYKEGKYDGYFINIPETEQLFVKKYETAIDSEYDKIASSLKTTSSTVKTKDTDTLNTFQKTVDYVEASLEAGTMKPADAVATVGAVGQATAESLQLPNSQLSYQASQIEFLNGLIDYVPATWKPALKSKLDQAYATLSLTGSQLTPEQIERKNNLSDFTTGIVADILYNNENFTLDDALAAVDEITKANLLTRSIKGTTKWPEVKDSGEGNFAGNLDDAIDFNDFAANNTSMLYVVYDDDADAALESASTGQPAAPKLKWMDPELEQTFNNASQILKVQISALTGVDEAKISYAPENQNGLLVPSPVFAVPTASGIDAYRVRGESIQVYSDSGWKTVAQVSKNLKQVESQGMFLQVRKEAAQGRIDRNSNPATMDTSDSWKRTNLWALDPRKTIEEAGSRQKAQQLVDKLVRESGDDVQLRGELEGYIREIYG